MTHHKSRYDKELAEFGRWSRHLRRLENVGLRGYLRRGFQAARRPADFMRSAARCLSEYGPSVRDGFGLPLHRQATDLAACRIVHGLDAIAYYRFQLYRPDRRAMAARFVQTSDVGRVLKWLVHSTPGYPAVFRDKRTFNEWCDAHGLPGVPNLVEFERGEMVQNRAGRIPRCDLFSKPSNWQGGRGAERWRCVSGERWVAASGHQVGERELLEYLRRQSIELDRPMLLQRLLVNHRALRALVDGGLCTARVVTLRRPGGRAELLLAVYRMPVAQSVADNFDLGGIAAPVDVVSGELGAGIRKYPRVIADIHAHPDTGRPIAGVRLPFWPETSRLVVRAHDAIGWPSVPAIGWDVALLEDGPVLLEGNNVPCSTLAQMPSGVPLAATPFIACVNEHVRATRQRGATDWPLRAAS